MYWTINAACPALATTLAAVTVMAWSCYERTQPAIS